MHTGTQGLAPHHDDVELWICQTQGSKRWRLYKPHMQLPALPSPDLSAEEIGEPVMEVTLQVSRLALLAAVSVLPVCSAARHWLACLLWYSGV